MTSDPYALLGVPRGASINQIKAAHRALAKRYHPDAPTADAKRFLRVQEAYQLLSDPLRRREWDARHAPAPVRADQPPGTAPRARRSATGPRGTSAAGGGRRPSTEPPREQPSRSYAWSASEVPWWEEGTRDAQRAGRGRAGAAGGAAASGTSGATAADGATAAGGQRTTGAPRAGADRRTAAPPGSGEPAAAAGWPQHGSERNDFDVYSRSSGAAWSSAARAYFRRADQDLPRRGSFHRQGSQPLTAARARAAAAEEARRRASIAPEPEPAPARPPASPSSAAAAGRGTPPGPRTSERSAEASRGQAGQAAQPPPSGAARPLTQPAYAHAGVAHDAGHIAAVREAARQREASAEWPSRGQRVRMALLASLPLALLVGYGGPHAVGCADPASACPPALLPAQLLSVAALFALLLALPRLSFIAATASAGVVVAGGVALIGAWLLGVRPPQAATLPAWAILGGAIVLVGAYLVAGTWLLTDRRRLPWVGPRMARR